MTGSAPWARVPVVGHTAKAAARGLDRRFDSLSEQAERFQRETAELLERLHREQDEAAQQRHSDAWDGAQQRHADAWDAAHLRHTHVLELLQRAVDLIGGLTGRLGGIEEALLHLAVQLRDVHEAVVGREAQV